jgi:hypothetical protein
VEPFPALLLPLSFNPYAAVAHVETASGDHTTPEWGGGLARVEEKNQKEGELDEFARTREGSFVSTTKDLLPSSKMVGLGEAQTGSTEWPDDAPPDLQSPCRLRAISEVSDSVNSQQTPGNHRFAFFAAIDAHEHLEIHQIDIVKAMGSPETPIVALAGFNEGLMQEGDGLLLQEIHILPSKDLTLQQHILDAVGEVCSPFPSMIFMPSGETFRPPVFNADGKTMTFEDLVSSSASQSRFDIATEKGMTLVDHESTIQHNHSTSNNREDGPSRGGQTRCPPRQTRRASTPRSRITRSGSGNEPQSGEEQPDEEQFGDEGSGGGGISSNTATGDENTRIANAEGGQTPQDPPVPGDNGSHQQPHRFHFDIKAAIYQPSPGSSLLQKLQLIGDFDFQVCFTADIFSFNV